MKPVFDENGLAKEAGEIRCYYYDAVTFEYMGWSDEYINLGVSMPGHSTDIEPGDEVAGKVAVFQNGGWVLNEDHRGEVVYNSITGEPVTIESIGPYPDGTQTTKPEESEKTNAELLSLALAELSAQYKKDIFDLNMAYVAAIVNDGASEAGKISAVRDELAARKVKYMSDISAARAQYPVE